VGYKSGTLAGGCNWAVAPTSRGERGWHGRGYVLVQVGEPDGKAASCGMELDFQIDEVEF
jgi:hypothetical protein